MNRLKKYSKISIVFLLLSVLSCSMKTEEQRRNEAEITFYEKFFDVDSLLYLNKFSDDKSKSNIAKVLEKKGYKQSTLKPEPTNASLDDRYLNQIKNKEEYELKCRKNAKNAQIKETILNDYYRGWHVKDGLVSQIYASNAHCEIEFEKKLNEVFNWRGLNYQFKVEDKNLIRYVEKSNGEILKRNLNRETSIFFDI